jgi:hypothetical protein
MERQSGRQLSADQDELALVVAVPVRPGNTHVGAAEQLLVVRRADFAVRPEVVRIVERERRRRPGDDPGEHRDHRKHLHETLQRNSLPLY